MFFLFFDVHNSCFYVTAVPRHTATHLRRPATVVLLLKFWLYALLLLLSLEERYIFLFGTQGNDGQQMYCVKNFNLDMILSGG